MTDQYRGGVAVKRSRSITVAHLTSDETPALILAENLDRVEAEFWARNVSGEFVYLGNNGFVPASPNEIEAVRLVGGTVSHKDQSTQAWYGLLFPGETEAWVLVVETFYEPV